LQIVNNLKFIEWKSLFLRFGSLFIDRIVGFISTLLMAQWSNVSTYGEIILVYSIVEILLVVTNLNLNSSVTIEISKKPNITYNLIKKVTIFRLWILPILLLFSVFISVANENVSLTILTFILLSESLNSFTQIYLGVLFSTSKFGSIFSFTLISRGTQLILLLIFGFYWKSYWAVLIAIFIQYLLLFLLVSYISFKNILITNYIDTNLTKMIWKYKYLSLNQIIDVLHEKADQLILAMFLAVSQIGIYGTGYLFYRNLGIVGNSIYSVYLPKYSKAISSENRLEIRNVFFEGFGVSIIIGTACAVLVYFISPIFIELFWGYEYDGAKLIIKILSFTIPIMFLNSAAGYFINSLEKGVVTLITSTISLLINVVLNLIYIKKYGIIAAAIITNISVSINLAILLIYLGNYFKKN